MAPTFGPNEEENGPGLAPFGENSQGRLRKVGSPVEAAVRGPTGDASRRVGRARLTGEDGDTLEACSLERSYGPSENWLCADQNQAN